MVDSNSPRRRDLRTFLLWQSGQTLLGEKVAVSLWNVGIYIYYLIISFPMPRPPCSMPPKQFLLKHVLRCGSQEYPNPSPRRDPAKHGGQKVLQCRHLHYHICQAHGYFFPKFSDRRLISGSRSSIRQAGGR